MQSHVYYVMHMYRLQQNSHIRAAINAAMSCACNIGNIKGMYSVMSSERYMNHLQWMDIMTGQDRT